MRLKINDMSHSFLDNSGNMKKVLSHVNFDDDISTLSLIGPSYSKYNYTFRKSIWL